MNSVQLIQFRKLVKGKYFQSIGKNKTALIYFTDALIYGESSVNKWRLQCLESILQILKENSVARKTSHEDEPTTIGLDTIKISGLENDKVDFKLKKTPQFVYFRERYTNLFKPVSAPIGPALASTEKYQKFTYLRIWDQEETLMSINETDE